MRLFDFKNKHFFYSGLNDTSFKLNDLKFKNTFRKFKKKLGITKNNSELLTG